MINPIILSFSFGFDSAIKIEKSNLIPFSLVLRGKVNAKTIDKDSNFLY